MCASQDPIATLWVGDDLRCQLISNRYIYIFTCHIYICITDSIHTYIYIYMHKSVGNQRMRHVDMYPLVGFCMFLIVFVSSQSSIKSGVEAHGQIFRSTFRSSSKLITYRTYQNCVDFRQQTSCQHIYICQHMSTMLLGMLAFQDGNSTSVIRREILAWRREAHQKKEDEASFFSHF